MAEEQALAKTGSQQGPEMSPKGEQSQDTQNVKAPLKDRSTSAVLPRRTTLGATAATKLPEFDMPPDVAAKYDAVIADAVKVVGRFISPRLLKDQSIPRELLFEASGLLFLTVYKLGFLVSGKVGKGFVIAKTADGWSPPSFVGTAGLGFGMMAGAERVDYMVILGSRQAVNVFTRDGQIQLGSELDIAVGPVGRAASASINIGSGGVAPNYSYSHCVGLYGGIGLSGAGVITRKAVNRRFYGPFSSQTHILSGAVSAPRVKPLIDALDNAMGITRNPAAAPAGSASSDPLSVYTVTASSGAVRSGELVLAEGMSFHSST